MGNSAVAEFKISEGLENLSISGDVLTNTDNINNAAILLFQRTGTMYFKFGDYI